MPVSQEALSLHSAPPESAGRTHLPSARPFVIVLALFLLALEAAAWLYLLPHRVAQIMDFRQLYTAGYMLRVEPTHLYDIARQMQMQTALTGTPPDGLLLFNHTAFEALFFLPLSYLSYAHAYMAMIAVSVALIAVCFFSLRPLFSTTISLWQPRPGLMFFPFLATAVAVMHGQDSLLFLALCCLTLCLLQKDSDFFSGMLLAATLFKPQFTLPLAILLIARRGWKFLAGFASGSALILLLCLRLVHLSGLRAFLHVLAFTDSGGKHALVLPGDPSGTNPLYMPNLHGLFFFVTFRWLPHNAHLFFVAGVSLAALLWAIRRVRMISGIETAFAYALTWAILLSYLDHISDMPLWLLPLAVLACTSRASRLKSLIIDTAFILPACIVFLLGTVTDPNFWLWTLSVPLFVTALLLERAGSQKEQEAQEPLPELA